MATPAKTTVVFETATFADAIKKAARVAPAKGKAFDEAGGIHITITTGEEPSVIVRATNLDVFQTEWVDCVSAEGESTVWRVPTGVIEPFVSSLPIGTGREIKVEEVRDGLYSHLKITSGRSRARVNLLEHTEYPTWGAFDPEDLEPILDFGGKIDMVEWAANQAETPPLSGVNFTGSEVQSTDRYRVAVVPMVIPGLTRSVTVPSGILGQILKQTGEVRVKFTENQLLMMPDPATQIYAVIYGGDYPALTRIKDRVRTDVIEVRKEDLLAVISRSTLASKGDRVVVLKMFIGKEEIACFTEGTDNVSIGDVLEVPGQAIHDRVEIKFTPKNLTDALNKSPNDRVKIHYNSVEAMNILYIDGGSGFETWVVTTRGNQG